MNFKIVIDRRGADIWRIRLDVEDRDTGRLSMSMDEVDRFVNVMQKGCAVCNEPISISFGEVDAEAYPDKRLKVGIRD